jgi:hypothetical protein
MNHSVVALGGSSFQMMIAVLGDQTQLLQDDVKKQGQPVLLRTNPNRTINVNIIRPSSSPSPQHHQPSSSSSSSAFSLSPPTSMLSNLSLNNNNNNDENDTAVDPILLAQSERHDLTF